MKIGSLEFRKSTNFKKDNNIGIFFGILLIVVIAILIADVTMKFYCFFQKPPGGILVNKSSPKFPAAVLHPGLTALQIPGLDSSSWKLGLALLVVEASIAVFIGLRILFQNYEIVHNNTQKNITRILSLQLGTRSIQKFSYITVFLCLIVCVIDRSYTFTLNDDGNHTHYYAIIDWIPIKIGYMNLTDMLLLILGIFIIINSIYFWIEKGIKRVLILTDPTVTNKV